MAITHLGLTHALRTAALSCAVLSTPALAQAVLVVDASGGGAFTELQAGVDAANPGDTVLVKTGQYAGVTIDKELFLIADDGASVQITGSVHVLDVDSGTVRVHRISATAPGFPVSPVLPALIVDDCLGAVWIEDCSFTGGFAIFGGSVSANITASSQVVLQDTTIASGQGGQGLIATRSTMQAFGCSMTGGTGGGISSTGGTGLDVRDSSVYLQGCTAQGGMGTSSGPIGGGCLPAGNGGVGATMTGATSVLQAVATNFVGGAGGNGFSFCVPGEPGEPTAILAGTFVPELATTSYELEAHPVAREGGRVDYTITGPAGDAVFLALASTPEPFFFAPIHAPLLLETSTLLVIPLGALPASGSVTIPTVVPELGPAAGVVTLYAQVLGQNAVDGVVGGSGQGITLLDGSL